MVRLRLLLSVILLVCFVEAGDAADPTYLEEKLKHLEEKLERARRSLHEAQIELGQKADRISELEDEELEKDVPSTPLEIAQPEATTRPASVKEAPVKKKAAKLEYIVEYAKNSAANLEARESARKWVSDRLKENGKRTVSLLGLANDRPYQAANEEIAKNRASFLASYLRVNGIPADSITSVTSRSSAIEGAGGRRVIISLVEPK